MGCAFSSKLHKENLDLKRKVAILVSELKNTRRHNEDIEKLLSGLEHEIKKYKTKTDNAANLISLYKNVLYTENDKTADIIMKSTLHLEYMNDLVEKKHIKGVLRATYIMTNEYHKYRNKKHNKTVEGKNMKNK